MYLFFQIVSRVDFFFILTDDVNIYTHTHTHTHTHIYIQVLYNYLFTTSSPVITKKAFEINVEKRRTCW